MDSVAFISHLGHEGLVVSLSSYPEPLTELILIPCLHGLPLILLHKNLRAMIIVKCSYHLRPNEKKHERLTQSELLASGFRLSLHLL